MARAWVAELSGDVLTGWPTGMRIIVRKERPHPGAQLRFTDIDGLRLTAFATNATGAPIAALELRHRQRARAEDHIRAAWVTGLRNLPLHDTARNPCEQHHPGRSRGTRRDSQALSLSTTTPNDRNGPPRKPANHHER